MSTTHEQHEHDLGLQHDLGTLSARRLGRRGVLGILGGLSALGVAGCADDDAIRTPASGAGAPSTPTAGTRGSISMGEIPEEMAGPFPSDGSNGPNVLTESGIVRGDITTSFAGASGVADGVPVTVKFRVYDLRGEEIAPMAGAALYAWDCDREGNYSMYDGPALEENFLRGVQEADADGWLTFTTIFPGCYPGRWPHIHFEVYESLDHATSASNKLCTSQLAFPAETCEQVYATEGYEQSARNLAEISLDSDMIFSDGYSLQMARMTGEHDDALTATLNVPI